MKLKLIGCSLTTAVLLIFSNQAEKEISKFISEATCKNFLCFVFSQLNSILATNNLIYPKQVCVKVLYTERFCLGHLSNNLCIAWIFEVRVVSGWMWENGPERETQKTNMRSKDGIKTKENWRHGGEEVSYMIKKEQARKKNYAQMEKKTGQR